MQDPVMNAARMGASETQAHLLIHATDEHPGPCNRLEAHWHRLIALCVPKHPGEQGPLLVRIHDMQGHEVAAFEHTGPLLDVACRIASVIARRPFCHRARRQPAHHALGASR